MSPPPFYPPRICHSKTQAISTQGTLPAFGAQKTPGAFGSTTLDTGMGLALLGYAAVGGHKPYELHSDPAVPRVQGTLVQLGRSRALSISVAHSGSHHSSPARARRSKHQVDGFGDGFIPAFCMIQYRVPVCGTGAQRKHQQLWQWGDSLPCSPPKQLLRGLLASAANMPHSPALQQALGEQPG